MKLFDSTVLIAHLRGELKATKLVRAAVDDDAACCSVLSRVELEGGMRSSERHDVRRLFAGLDLIPVSDPIAAQAGESMRAFRRSHQGVDLVDHVIGATALVTGADLLTLNVKHFPMIKGLKPAYR